MRFTRSLTTLCSFTCLALFLSSSLVPQAHAGWGKGGKKNGETSSSPAATNSSPTISGSPATSAEEGNFYSFQPVAGDVDGDRLSFKIRNQPAWATFDTSTGRLSGTPDAADVGTYDNIQIGVTDGTVITSLPVFSITVSGAIAVSGAADQPGNDAPTISGSPATSAEEGSFYSFQPVAGDVDGDRLSFKIRNQPAWATFDTSTGRLSGTPDAADIGTYDNIKIGVTDGTVITALPVFSITVSGAIAVSGAAGQTGSVSLEWVAPTRRSDGSPISVSELAGYTVHYGPSQGNYTSSIGIDDPFATSVVVTDLPVGTYYFALTVDDINGQRSDYSGALLKRVQ